MPQTEATAYSLSHFVEASFLEFWEHKGHVNIYWASTLSFK